MLAGALMGDKINKKPVLILIFAFLSHFVLDALPHFEYVIKPLTLLLDLSLGTMIACVLAHQDLKKAKIIIASAFVAILPDSPAFINIVMEKITGAHFSSSILDQLMLAHNYFHTKITFTVPATIGQAVLGIFLLSMLIYCAYLTVSKLDHKKHKHVR
jgi:hypothetical protein